MLKIALGHAEEIDTRAGVRMVIEQAQRQLGAVHADAGIILAGIEFDHKPMLDEILAAFRLTGALLDRLNHHVHILEMNGESYRGLQRHYERRAA